MVTDWRENLLRPFECHCVGSRLFHLLVNLAQGSSYTESEMGMPLAAGAVEGDPSQVGSPRTQVT